jgi:hypothetical protein
MAMASSFEQATKALAEVDCRLTAAHSPKRIARLRQPMDGSGLQRAENCTEGLGGSARELAARAVAFCRIAISLAGICRLRSFNRT